MIQSGERVDGENRLDFSQPCQAQNLRGVVVMRDPVLHDIQQDVQVEEHFHRCLSSRCWRYATSGSPSGGTRPVMASTSGWIEDRAAVAVTDESFATGFSASVMSNSPSRPRPRTSSARCFCASSNVTVCMRGLLLQSDQMPISELQDD